ncbi:hypothetical protein D9619_008778 [Psilocybe cf. subviscida]|uniref:Uncharacterized protein n=1 Tax=Psilocybe cf. subviscida TaxID=2480587 RepID=A0A8H5F0T3_9AGAR|nr:hypothetical protein D9619_008778 [Psilocybe cf. subviscida]
MSFLDSLELASLFTGIMMHITLSEGSGSGGSSGRGGDIGSYNTSKTSYDNMNNDNSTRQRVDGDNYSGVHNTPNSNSAPTEEELLQRIKAAREKLAAKKELERLKKLEEELKQLEAELEEEGE